MLDYSPPPASIAAETRHVGSCKSVTSLNEVDVSKLNKFVLERNFLSFEGGRVLLRLHSRPVIQVDPNSLSCEVMGWGINLPLEQVGTVDRHMARRFLTLFTKADSDQLSSTDQKWWVSILDQVDFVSFCIDRAAPHYIEGTLRRHLPQCYVDWFDGRTEMISQKVATAFSNLQPGEAFGAYVKLGRDNTALSVERVTMLSEC